ncbi:MAG: hypothetical protein MK136_04410 [Pirellulaceae bacterium]|nr:hypothetical protein [Pirellulaceae bacterium]
MRILLSLSLLVACVAFIGCGGTSEIAPVDGVSTEQTEQVAKDKEAMMKDAMEKMKGMQSPSGQSYDEVPK